MLTNPTLLTEGLNIYKAEQEDENAPLHARVQVIDGLLEENQSQLKRLIDLYISGDFPKEMLTDKKTRLETNVRALENERSSILGHIDRQVLTTAQIQDLHDFANMAAKGLEEAEKDLSIRREIIDTIDLKVTLTVEDGQRVAYVHTILGNNTLSFKLLDL